MRFLDIVGFSFTPTVYYSMPMSLLDLLVTSTITNYSAEVESLSHLLSDLGINAISLYCIWKYSMGYEWDNFLPIAAKAELQEKQKLVEF